MQLSEHFALREFEKNDPVPDECLPILQRFCKEVLEPVRAQFGPIVITSGYRSEHANELAHGIQNSEHIYSPDHCAADFYPETIVMGFTGLGNVNQRVIFDWMRLNPNLPYHQLILEHSATGSSVVHVSMNISILGVRSVLEGATHNAEPYIKVDHVDFATNHDAVQDATA